MGYTPLASVREKSWHNLPLPPHQLVRLPGDDEFVEKEAATEGGTIAAGLEFQVEIKTHDFDLKSISSCNSDHAFSFYDLHHHSASPLARWNT